MDKLEHVSEASTVDLKLAASFLCIKILSLNS